jgi:hypothetical protein
MSVAMIIKAYMTNSAVATFEEKKLPQTNQKGM